MKKLFFSLSMTFISLFVIWYIIGFTYYGINITNKHLDLYATFQKLNMFDKWGVSGLSFRSTLSYFRNMIQRYVDNGIFSGVLNSLGVKQVSGGFGILLTAIQALWTPLYSISQSVLVLGYLVVMLVEIGWIFLSITLGFGEFVLEPVFVDAFLVV